MSISRKKQWYVASIGSLTACSHDRLEAFRLVLAMFEAGCQRTRQHSL